MIVLLSHFSNLQAPFFFLVFGLPAWPEMARPWHNNNFSEWSIAKAGVMRFAIANR